MNELANDERTPAPQRTTPPRGFAPLNRQPSQQELEIAQHMVDQTRVVPRYPSPDDSSQQNGHAHEPQPNAAGGSRTAGEHHDLSDSMQTYANPYPNMSRAQDVPTPPASIQPASDTTPNGQMCR